MYCSAVFLVKYGPSLKPVSDPFTKQHSHPLQEFKDEQGAVA